MSSTRTRSASVSGRPQARSAATTAWLAGLELLTGPQAGDLLDAAVAPAGGQIRRWALRDVDTRPDGRTTVSYTTTVRWADGAERSETLAATTLAEPLPADAAERALVVSDGQRHVQVWRFPFDPELPGLPAVTFAEPAAQVAAMLGLRPADLQIRVRSYRPRKRAVVELSSGSERVFVKAMRPSRAARVARNHTVLGEAGVPVPPVLSVTDTGLLALGALPGTTLRSEFEAGMAAVSSAGVATQLLELLDGLPPITAVSEPRLPWAAHASHYARIVAAASPTLAAPVHRIADTLAATLTHTDAHETTHGDFYDAQLLMTGQTVTGLLDLDTVGPGRRVDDLASLVAHLSVLSTLPLPGADQARRTLAAWLPVFDRRVDPTELRLRTAGVVLSLATGPFQAQEPGWEATTAARVRLAQRWLQATPPSQLSTPTRRAASGPSKEEAR